MRTLDSIHSEDKKKRIAEETMEIYAPLADRMGMNHIRDELEDLSFKMLNPDARNLVVERLSLNKENRENSFRKISNKGIVFDFIDSQKTNDFDFDDWLKVWSKKEIIELIDDIGLKYFFFDFRNTVPYNECMIVLKK